jgi:beta-glucosidase
VAKLTFPEGFLWGTATAAHQIEGNNKNTDWWEWEYSKDYETNDREYPLEPSGLACDSYNRYEEDFDLAKEMKNNSIRFSVEWARIEPEEGKFDQNEIEHYKKMIQAARDRGLKTFVTLHHFTNPLWFAKKGGWTNLGAPKLFARYAQKCAHEFGDSIDFYMTINEPQVLVLQGYLRGMWPPNKTNAFLSLIAQFNLMRCHRSAYDAIKSVNKKYKVGIVKHIVWYESHTHKFHYIDKIACRILYFLNNEFFLLPLGKKNDFIGVNYYFTTRLKHLKGNNPNDKVSDLNWWINPVGLENILLSLRKYKVPIYITENGVADAKDALRKEFIRDMLVATHRAIQKGADVRGYFYWSLVDNYEWHHGFWPRFGLIHIKRHHNLDREMRPSAFYYTTVCDENAVYDID